MTRAIVLTGDARAFAAGADIAEFAAEGPRLEVWDRLWSVGMPVIAAVRGVALGGGLELAMSCDMMVVADDARLGQPEINLGVMPGAGGTQRLTRAVGKTLATEMVLLGREISGREAEAHGLANRCVPAGARRCPSRSSSRARSRAQAPHAVRVAKRAISRAFEESLHAALLDERRAFYALLQTDDAREGVRAFLDKRKPTWQRTMSDTDRPPRRRSPTASRRSRSRGRRRTTRSRPICSSRCWRRSRRSNATRRCARSCSPAKAKAFCAGQALDDARTLVRRSRPADLGATVEKRYSPLLLALLTLEKPVVAAVNGVAAGAGHGDRVRVRFPHRRRERVVHHRVREDRPRPRQRPLVHAAAHRRLRQSARAVHALGEDRRGARRRAGPVHEGRPGRAVPCATRRRSRAALARGPRSIGLIKRELVRNGLGDVQRALAYEAELQSVAGATDDFAEGVAAFAGKARAGVHRDVTSGA